MLHTKIYSNNPNERRKGETPKWKTKGTNKINNEIVGLHTNLSKIPLNVNDLNAQIKRMEKKTKNPLYAANKKPFLNMILY